jgi:hypothetical protein
MGRAGRERVEARFAWEQQAPRYVEVIDALVPRAR